MSVWLWGEGQEVLLAMSCRKLGYWRKADAKRAVKRIQTSLGGGKPVHFYRCPRCGKWHWTQEAQR